MKYTIVKTKFNNPLLDLRFYNSKTQMQNKAFSV